MTIREFESEFWDTEGIFIIVRGDPDDSVGNYDYQRMLSGNSSISDLRSGRIEPLLGNYDYVILDGDLESPHGRTKLSTVRDSYPD